MRTFALTFAFVAIAACAAAQSTPAWEYAGHRGPLEWGRIDPSYQGCSKGHEQSPIDIRGAHLNKSLQPLEFHYIGGSVELENTGPQHYRSCESGQLSGCEWHALRTRSVRIPPSQRKRGERQAHGYGCRAAPQEFRWQNGRRRNPYVHGEGATRMRSSRCCGRICHGRQARKKRSPTW